MHLSTPGITGGQFAAVEGNCERAVAHCDARYTSESHNQLPALRACSWPHCPVRGSGGGGCFCGASRRQQCGNVVMWIFELVKQFPENYRCRHVAAHLVFERLLTKSSTRSKLLIDAKCNILKRLLMSISHFGISLFEILCNVSKYIISKQYSTIPLK